MNANKETLLETCRSNYHSMEAKLETETTESCQLKTEVKHLQDATSFLRSQVTSNTVDYCDNSIIDEYLRSYTLQNILQVASLEKENAKLQSEKTEREDKFSKLKVAMEEKVSS